MAKLNNPPDNDFVFRDYHHAAKTFTTQPGYPLAPYHSFLFHVFIDFNTGVSAGANGQLVGDDRQAETRTISVLVKAADLPKFKFDTEVLNQYNRKRIVYTKMQYEPMQLTFHDDVAQTVRNMWIDYQQYYVADSNKTFQQLSNGGVYPPDPYSSSYGLDNGSTIPFIKSIRIFSMGNHEYSSMQLINPVISDIDFSSHDYSEGAGTMEMKMSIEYETVLFASGTTESIIGFGEDNVPYYDNNKSLLGQNPQDDIDFGQRAREPETSITRAIVVADRVERLASQAIDRVPGRVNRNRVRFTENQYVDLSKAVNESITNSKQVYKFPEAEPIDQLDQYVDLLQQGQYKNTEIERSDAVESNGGNVSAARNNINIGRFGITNIEPNVRPALVVSPKVPENLTPGEIVLFNRAYPPLSSTDPRSKLPPYV